MKANAKHITSWLVVVSGLVGIVIAYQALWTLMAYFVAGLVWYAELAILVSGPISGIGAALAFRRPRQRLAFSLGMTGFILWIILWALLTAPLLVRKVGS